MVADVDGDGDVDVVHATGTGLAFAEQRNGSFILWNRKDNPFWRRSSFSAMFECWTLVDFDGDGDLDLVITRPSQLSNPESPREVLYYEQAAVSGWRTQFRLFQRVSSTPKVPQRSSKSK